MCVSCSEQLWGEERQQQQQHFAPVSCIGCCCSLLAPDPASALSVWGCLDHIDRSRQGSLIAACLQGASLHRIVRQQLRSQPAIVAVGPKGDSDRSSGTRRRHRFRGTAAGSKIAKFKKSFSVQVCAVQRQR